MRAVDREDLKLVSLHAPHPARDVGCRSIPGAREGVPILGKSRLLLGKICEWTKRYPRLEWAISTEAGEDVAEHWD